MTVHARNIDSLAFYVLENVWPVTVGEKNSAKVSYTQEGMHAEAIRELQTAFERSGGNTEVLSFLGFAYAASGKRAETIKMLIEPDEQSSAAGPAISPGRHARRTRSEGALEWLERSFEKHAVQPVYSQSRADG